MNFVTVFVLQLLLMTIVRTGKLNSVKVLLCLAVLLLVAKPFLGFSIISRVHPPSEGSILVKSFTKRKQEYVKNSNFSITDIQQKLASPVNQLVLRFVFLLNILFPALCFAANLITAGFLNEFALRIAPRRPAYLLLGNFIV